MGGAGADEAGREKGGLLGGGGGLVKRVGGLTVVLGKCLSLEEGRSKRAKLN